MGMTSEFVDMGLVTDLSAMQMPGNSNAVLISGTSPDHSRWVRVVTRGAAQVLWFRLAHILFPRAAEQITHRTSTAVLRSAAAPTITSSFEVLYEEEDEQEGEDALIQVIGIGGIEEWCIRFSPESAKQLWTSLEKTLHMGGGSESSAT
jgi:hypothetical protein